MVKGLKINKQMTREIIHELKETKEESLGS